MISNIELNSSLKSALLRAVAEMRFSSSTYAYRDALSIRVTNSSKNFCVRKWRGKNHTSVPGHKIAPLSSTRQAERSMRWSFISYK